MMIEAVIAIALIAVCAGAVLSAVLSIQHRTLFVQPSAALTLDAQNVLTDLRAATAYDGAELAALGGRNAAFDATEPGSQGSPEPIRIVVAVSTPALNGAVVAAVSVRDAQGRSVLVQGTLTHEAPAPGSIVAAEAPSAPNVSAAPTGSVSAGSETPLPVADCMTVSSGCRRARGPIAL